MQDNVDDVLDEVLTASMSIVGADAGYIRLFARKDADPIEDEYPFAVQKGFSEAYINYFASLPRPVDDNSRLAIANGRRVIIEDMTKHPAFLPHHDMVLSERYISLQGTPMMSANARRSLGVICTHFFEAYTPPEETFDTLDLYAELAATAIERHQLIAELARKDRTVREIAGTQRVHLKRIQAQLRHLGQKAFFLEPEDVSRLTSSMADEIERWIDEADEEGAGLQPTSASESSALPYGMTARELEVLLHVWRGLGDKQIAEALTVSRFTVHKHVRSILQKMNVETRTQASLRAEQEGLFRLQP